MAERSVSKTTQPTSDRRSGPLDAIDLTLKHSAAIASFQRADQTERPWIYDIGGR